MQISHQLSKTIGTFFWFVVSRRAVLILAASLSIGASQFVAVDAAEDIPAPEDITLVTADRVELRCTYFAGKESKKTVPLILLHGWNGQRGEYAELAKTLQLEGHAVIVPDLRGHGDSTQQRRPDSRSKLRLDRSRMRSSDVLRMIDADMEAVKKFLMKKNNEGKLNIELLGIIAAEEGTLIALNWAVKDWGYPRLPTHKQGQDVKALMLLSPIRLFRGISIKAALATPAVRSGLSMLVIVGSEDRKAMGEATGLHGNLKRFHGPQDKIPRAEDRDLFMVPKDTSVQGTRLLANKSLKTDEAISTFIQWRLTDRAEDFPWTMRTSPFGD